MEPLDPSQGPEEQEPQKPAPPAFVPPMPPPPELLRQKVPHVPLTPMMDFTSGYIVRARDELPKEGTRAPWKMHQNYILDKMQLSRRSLEDGVMQFGR